MKRFLALILAVSLALMLIGCSYQATEDQANLDEKSMFIKVESGPAWIVVYQRDTKVMYVVSYEGYNTGNFTVMLNPDGTPQTWQEK